MEFAHFQNRFFVAEHFRRAGIDNGQIILEPCGRNTAPALTLAALHILETGSDAVMFVSPPDHIVTDNPAFNKSSEAAIQYALDGHNVTLGMAKAYWPSIEIPNILAKYTRNKKVAKSPNTLPTINDKVFLNILFSAFTVSVINSIGYCNH